MLPLAITLGSIVLRTVVVYAVVLVGLRLGGKREMGQMTLFDLVLLLLIANAVQNAMVGPDNSLLGGLVAAGVLMASNALVARLTMRWPRLRRSLVGTPTLLVLHGALLSDHLRHEGIDESSLHAAIREHGLARLEEVEIAVLEIDGSISIVPASEASTGTVRRIRRRSWHKS